MKSEVLQGICTLSMNSEALAQTPLGTVTDELVAHMLPQCSRSGVLLFIGARERPSLEGASGSTSTIQFRNLVLLHALKHSKAL